jgi:hypothetical protein
MPGLRRVARLGWNCPGPRGERRAKCRPDGGQNVYESMFELR